jgi:hypothetical protein
MNETKFQNTMQFVELDMKKKTPENILTPTTGWLAKKDIIASQAPMLSFLSTRSI